MICVFLQVHQKIYSVQLIAEMTFFSKECKNSCCMFNTEGCPCRNLQSLDYLLEGPWPACVEEYLYTVEDVLL